MMHTLLKLTVGTAVVGGLAFGGWAFAHGGGHGHGHDAHRAMHRLIDALELDDDQVASLRAVHGVMDRLHHGGGPSEHVHNLALKVYSDQLDTGGVRQMIDEHVEALRHQGYRLGDALVALIDSLDARQREVVDQHLAEAFGTRD